MNFGFRLPGPFRIGVSDKGRITGGVTLGPVSVSGQLGGGPEVRPGTVLRCTVEQAVYAARQQGWQVKAYDGQAASIQRGWRSAWIKGEPGGVRVMSTANPRWVAVWLAVGLAVAALCGLLATGTI